MLDQILVWVVIVISLSLALYNLHDMYKTKKSILEKEARLKAKYEALWDSYFKCKTGVIKKRKVAYK